MQTLCSRSSAILKTHSCGLEPPSAWCQYVCPSILMGMGSAPSLFGFGRKRLVSGVSLSIRGSGTLVKSIGESSISSQSVCSVLSFSDFIGPVLFPGVSPTTTAAIHRLVSHSGWSEARALCGSRFNRDVFLGPLSFFHAMCILLSAVGS